MTSTTSDRLSYNVEHTVLDRYRSGAERVEASLCCPIDYDRAYLDILPQEILEKDYGCGDPSRYVNPGETVLDLGSGAGKICYILSQKVGETGRVIGVDFNDTMLSLAKKFQSEIAEKIGYNNVQFFKGKIQDLSLDLDRLQSWLETHPVTNLEGMAALETERDRLEREAPLVADNSIDAIVSNCVLNLVRPQDKQQLFREMYRVLKRGGRAIISDIVCDEDPTAKIIDDPKLWSGCIAGAFREDTFLKMFADVGFYAIEIVNRQEDPWQTIDGIEFRSLTVRAYKGKEGECWERNQAVIYRGPWKEVRDDDGHVYKRGERTAVCDKTYHLLTDRTSPYTADFVPIEPYQNIPLEQAMEFDCKRDRLRHPRETKGVEYRVTAENDGSCCEPSECC